MTEQPGLAECGRLREQLDDREHGFAKLVLLAHERGDEFWQNELQIVGDFTLAEARAALGVEGPQAVRALNEQNERLVRQCAAALGARARADAWLAGRVRRDMTASIATATDLARDVVALTDELLEGD